MSDADDYFRAHSVPYRGGRWTYFEATHELLIVFGRVASSGDHVLIRQYRPPVGRWVISPPMGAFHPATDFENAAAAKLEAEGETGHLISEIYYKVSFARSPGMSNEMAHIYQAVYTGERCAQNLHEQEEIEPILIPNGSLHEQLLEFSANGDVLDASVAMLMVI
jgi:8-oxo-dGTP pyrophosphatase MutT (NUDIX family)